MGVALENARLFGQTKRLLAETDERAAELAVINEIGTALASQLEFEAIVRSLASGSKSLFAASSICRDPRPDLEAFSFPYAINEGVRQTDAAPMPLGRGLTSMVIERRGPVRFGTLAEQQRHDLVDERTAIRVMAGVPILAGETAVGVLVVESMTQHAYSDSDDALLSTIASSMGVALENARLFGETKRLLTETDERAAELAIINEVQRGLAERLDMQAMYDVVGDKLQDLRRPGRRYRGRRSRCLAGRFWYTIERGVRFPDEPMAIEAHGHACWRTASRS